MLDVRYCVIKGTACDIESSLNPDDVMIQNAINAGFTLGQVEVISQEEYDERKALEPKPTPPLSETDLLRLEMARSNAEMFEMMVAMMGGGM